MNLWVALALGAFVLGAGLAGVALLAGRRGDERAGAPFTVGVAVMALGAVAVGTPLLVGIGPPGVHVR